MRKLLEVSNSATVLLIWRKHAQKAPQVDAVQQNVMGKYYNYIVTTYLGTNLKLPVTSDFEIGKYIMA